MKDQAYKLRELVRKPTVIGITSGKGGVGKTNITINIAVCLAQQGLKVLVLDADLSLANVDLLFGINPQYNIKDVILGNKKVEDIIVEGPCKVKIIPASSGVEELADLDDGTREKFIESFKRIEEEFDFILVDTAAGMSKNVRNFLLASDEVIIVTTPELTALADAYAMIKVVSMNKSLGGIKILVNMVKSKDEAAETVERIRLVASKFLGLEVKNFGFIYDDISVVKAVASQTPFVISEPYSRASACVKIIAEKIRGFKVGANGRSPLPSKEEKSLFERIVEASTEPEKEEEILAEKTKIVVANGRSPKKEVMRKTDLVDRIASFTGTTKGKARVATNSLLCSIITALSEDEEVKIRGFGVFKRKLRKRRKFYNPKSRSLILSEARVIPQFKPSSILVKKVQNAPI